MTAVFCARWPGWCDSCDQRIAPGDDVTFDGDDALIHAGCRAGTDFHPVDPPPRPGPSVCGDCRLVHAGDCP